MRSSTLVGLLIALVLLGGCRQAGVVRAVPPAVIPEQNVQTGSWGGDHVKMMVAGDGATIQFDCAHGTIPGPIPLDGEERFSVAGLFYQEHGGPVSQNEQPVPTDVRYDGQVIGQQMTLIVIDAGTRQKIGAYALTYGASGFIVECL